MPTPVLDPTNYGNKPGDGPLRIGGMSASTPGGQQDLPSVMSPARKAQQPALELVRDLQGGTARMRERGEAYLPKGAGELHRDYNERVQRSVLHNMFARSVEGLTGLVFSSDPVMGDDVIPQVRDHWENIDLAGTHGDVFARQVMADALAAGHAAILVEHPNTEGRTVTAADPIRPYWVHVRKDDIMSWRTVQEDGRTVLTQVVIRERVTEPVGQFLERIVEQYRVFRRPFPGRVEYQVLRLTEDKTAVIVVDGGTYRNQQEIPLAEVVTSGHVSMFVSRPPLEDLADLNVAHYQQWSDYATSLHKTCVPLLFIAGLEQPTDSDGSPAGPIVAGPNTAIVSSSPALKAEYVSHTGASLASCKAALDDLVNHMGALGLSMLSPQKRTAETAEAKRLDRSQSDSALSVTARGLQDGLERALGFHAAYLGQPGGSIAVNRDFENLVMDAPVMDAYARLVQAGFPARPVLEMLKRGRRIPEDADLDALELEWMAGSAAAAAAREMAMQDAADETEEEALP